MGWSTHGESGGHAYMYWCMYTFKPRCRVTGTHTHTHTLCYTGATMFLCNYIKRFKLIWESDGHKYIYWCIIHILKKVWEQKWVTDTHRATQGHPCFHVTMHRGLRWYWASGGHKYMYWCIYTPTKVWDQKYGDCDKHTMPNRDTRVSIKLCIGGAANMGSQVDINRCTDAYTHSKQGVGTKMGDIHTNSAT